MLVENKTRADFEDFAIENIRDSLKESHILQSGDLKKYSEANLHECITVPTGPGEFDCKPNSSQDSWPQWLYSPPPVNFGSMLFDALGVGDYHDATMAMLALRSTIFTNVRSHYTTAGSGISVEEHAAMHSRLPRSDASYPHSVFAAPIFEVPADNSSKIVGLHGGRFAWDFALRGLLPDAVKGIHVILVNSCKSCYLR